MWIYNKIEWKKYPVIRIDFTGLVYSEGIEGFKSSFDNLIKNFADKFNIKLKSKNYKEAFKNLLEELAKKEKAVILIDEYDKPIVEYIEDTVTRNQMKNIVKDFYLILKESEQYIKFVFLFIHH